jgi:hypothetical protein
MGRQVQACALFFSCALSVFAAAACGSDDDAADGGLDAGADSDADADADSDSDVDTDTDTDVDTDADSGALEIVGEYHDLWGQEHSVTAEGWTTVYPAMGDAGPMTTVAHVTSFDNGADYLVAQNDGELSFFPELWSRYDWTFDDLADGGGDLYYCQIEYAAADEPTAAANGSADPGDLGAGCSGFSWSRLIEN